MEDILVGFFERYSSYAIVLSILVNIIVIHFGGNTQVFCDWSKHTFFGFWTGTLLSFIGESVGAIIAFLLYRKGFKKLSILTIEKYPKAKTLL
ncbi:hypothetical protein KHA80_21385 [Anaerobacillus sp. HL2]|nr:hypothetical protein KHA80_21385 [Anaerobacillus sp. HL2]